MSYKLKLPSDFAKEIAKVLEWSINQVNDCLEFSEDKEGFFYAKLKEKKFLEKPEFKKMCALVRELGGENYLEGMKAWKVPGPYAKKSTETPLGQGMDSEQSYKDARNAIPTDSSNLTRKTSTELKVTLEYEKIVPKMLPDEYESLKESIKTLGQLYPIIANPNLEILDGHSRFRICQELGLSPKYETRSFTSVLEEREFIVTVNLMRRHLNDLDRAALAQELERIEGERAKPRQEFTQLAGKSENGEPRTKAEIGGVQMNTTEKGKARDVAARRVGLSPTMYHRAKTIIDKGSDELKQAVREGKTSVSYAYKKIMSKERSLETPPLPEGVFDVVYADPPWEYYLNLRSSPDSHYGTMSMEALCDIKVPFAEDAILFLWTTNAQLENAFTLLKAWGCMYKSHLVWVKNRFGTGSYFRGQHELLLLAVKGNVPCPLEENRPSSVVLADVEEHSKKPDQVRLLIQKMFPNRKYLELFAREKTDGWESWGNELPP